MAKQVLLTGSYQYTEEQIHMIEKLGWKVTFVKNELEPIGVPADQFDVVVCNGLFLHNDIAEFKKLKMVQDWTDFLWNIWKNIIFTAIMQRESTVYPWRSGRL